MIDKKLLIAAGVLVLLAAAIWYCWNEPVRLNNDGTQKTSNGDFEGAISNFDAAIAFYPNLNPDSLKYAYLNRGYAKYRKGNMNDALADMEKAAELAPNEPLVYKMKGYVEYKMGAVEDGKKDIAKGLLLEWPTIPPDDPSIEMNVQGTIENLDYSMNK